MVKAYPLFTIVAVGISFLSGSLIDRYSAIKLIGFYQIPAILGFYIFSVCETLVGFSIGLICFAITAGSNNLIPNAFWAECFGTASLGKIKALAAGVMVVGSALGPLISGFLIDLNFNLNLQYNLFATYFVFSSVLLIMATRKAIATV
jgi:MFS family permease